MSLQSWKLKNEQHNEQRWHISVVLKTATPLHIGSGEFCRHDDIKDKDGEFVDINGCIKGKDNLPIIPGSTIKGKFYDWLKARELENRLLENIFGKGHDRKNGDQGRGGKAEFHDACFFNESRLTGEQPWPYWREKYQTYIEASTAINRHRKTALHESLHYSETVPPGICFELTITGVMSEEEASLLTAALDSIGNDGNQPCFGAGGANDYGRMTLEGYLEVKTMGAMQICEWLADLAKNSNDNVMAMDSVHALKLEGEDLTGLVDKGKKLFSLSTAAPKLLVTLNFDGPFLVNDPYAVKERKKDERTKTDHYPLLGYEQKPRLPAASFRGALRAQAERIIRTLGGKCCDTQNPCPQHPYAPLKTVDELDEKLCLACQIFGATGWKSVIDIGDFVCSNFDQQKKQDFVAIDRFHGGGKDGAKFDATHIERPVFQGSISFSPRLEKLEKNSLAWGKGLLKLVLRDLREGDITFGFGANKGYGGLQTQAVSIAGIEQLQDADVEAFRKKCLASQKIWPCLAARPPEKQSEKIPLAVVRTANNGFHNPYHFIPAEKPDTAHWPLKEALNEESHHSHAFYRDRTTDADEQLFHGRIVCSLTTETPMFIGADKEKDTEPAEIHNYRLNGQFAIPATSLRGMISSLAEAAGNSAMRVLTDGLLSFRKTADDALRNLGMVIVDKNNKWFVVRMNSAVKLKHAYTGSGMKEFIEACQSWSPEHNRVYYLNENPGEFDVPQDSYSEGMKPGILRILGKDGRTEELENKKHELFIPIPPKYVDTQFNTFDYRTYKQDFAARAMALPDAVKERYEQLADQRSLTQKNKKEFKEDSACQSVKWLPFHLKGAKREYNEEHKICKLPLREYDLVYYDAKGREVKELAFSSIWRGRVEADADKPQKVYSFIPDDLHPFNNGRTRISPAELLFGFTELNPDGSSKNADDALAFAGKVRVSAATFPDYPQDDRELLDDEITLKALSTPKLPSPALYFRSIDGSGNDYFGKQDLNRNDHAVKGRKYYLHALRTNDGKEQKLCPKGEPANGQNANPPWKTHDEQENKKLKVKIKPIQKDKTFYFHLDFNNLTRWELGMLCYALRPADSFRHRIGMGKPIGLGSVKVDIAALQTIDRKRRYSENSIDDERYNQHSWINADYAAKLENAGYSVGPNSNPLDPAVLRKTFTDTMDADIYRALELLGNPNSVKRPVHYPQVQDGHIEQENYKWFVANDQGSGQEPNKIGPFHQTLKTIDENTTELPVLTRHRWEENS